MFLSLLILIEVCRGQGSTGKHCEYTIDLPREGVQMGIHNLIICMIFVSYSIFLSKHELLVLIRTTSMNSYIEFPL